MEGSRQIRVGDPTLTLIAAFVFLSTVAVSAQDKGIGVAPVSPSEARRWALVMGVDGYVSFPKLRYCVKDAMLLADTLAKHAGYYENNVLIKADSRDAVFADQPTRDNILATAKAVAGMTTVEDTLLFFFSGHGTIVDQKGYLVPIDAKENTAEALVSIAEMRRILRDAPAKRKVFIIDACHSGSEKAGDDPSMQRGFQEALGDDSEGIVTMASCKASQTSLESPDKKQGLFTYWLVDGLRGGADQKSGNKDGLVDVGELNKYVHSRVSAEALKVHHHAQTPFIIMSAAGQIVLAKNAKIKIGLEDGDRVWVEDGRLYVEVTLSASDAESLDLREIKNAVRRLGEEVLYGALTDRGAADPGELVANRQCGRVKQRGKDFVGICSVEYEHQ